MEIEVQKVIEVNSAAGKTLQELNSQVKYNFSTPFNIKNLINYQFHISLFSSLN